MAWDWTDALDGLLGNVATGAGAVAAAYVAAYFGLRQYAKSRADEKAREIEARRRRVAEILVGVRAELRICCEQLWLQFDPSHMDRLEGRQIERLRGIKPKEMPQGRAADTNFMFAELKDEIEILPESVVDNVIAFYKCDQLINGLVRAFESGAYSKLSDDRQTEAVQSYFDLGLKSLRSGMEAITAITTYLRATDPVQFTQEWNEGEQLKKVGEKIELREKQRLERMQSMHTRPAAKRRR
jgi:hypothetical protein